MGCISSRIMGSGSFGIRKPRAVVTVWYCGWKKTETGRDGDINISDVRTKNGGKEK